ncbi:60S ribosomal protein L26, putative [Leishmania tarentolae]|uniref:60S ribosomal protein L26, putative n=1 Tax=Leishmania tarentolae TaxID=5689 RepID=A0A640KH55_LEITA|nr:60S ribosomal protein L26, putative [Leishmania tarentolae]
MDADGHSGAVCLLAVHLIDEDDPLEAVARRHLTLTALEGPALHDDLVVLAHGHGTHVVLGAQLLGERGAHQHTAHMAWGLKMRAAGLAAGTTLDADHFVLRGRDAGRKLYDGAYVRVEAREVER